MQSFKYHKENLKLLSHQITASLRRETARVPQMRAENLSGKQDPLPTPLTPLSLL